MSNIVGFSVLKIEEVFHKVGSSSTGLTTEEAGKRLLQFGRNELPEIKKRSILYFFFKQFKSILVGVLLLATVVSWFTRHTTDAYAILVVVLIDALIGFIQEWKAERQVNGIRYMHCRF